ncbi:phosphatase PAP2 family protein [Puia sp.]|uniref:phosphatase PAP2 family protein n=1 Tax=Puia sp. TaxID=2045100 RepID=UPI002F3E56EF
MRRLAIFLSLAAGLAGGAFGQKPGDSLFRIKSSMDIPLVVGGAALDLYNFSKISAKNETSLAKLNSLKISDLNWLDRWGVRPYSHSVDQLSYVPFYVAMPLPLIVFGVDKRMRKDFWKLTYLYGESVILTGVLYTSAVHWASRLRPLTYEAASPLKERQSSNSRNSFFAGHVALVGTSVFFIATTWAAYHPESDLKWVFYTGAGAITALTGYWRSRAGEHFPTDIALGAVIGVASGMLTPRLHMPKKLARHVSVAPVGPTGPGLTLVYKVG